MLDPQILRTTFNNAAREYDAVRPGYPVSLIEDVVALSGIPAGGRALEIGCGTGQATLPFAQRGYEILCLDIGPDLLTIAAENLRDYPNVRFRNIAFEDWPAQVGHFNLVYSATAFHWVARDVAYPKSALALKPGGALAVFANEHPGHQSGFFQEVQSIYREYTPEWPEPASQPSIEAQINARAEGMAASGLFSSVEVRTYPWSLTYSTVDYLRLLNTYSNHLSLEEGRRTSLYQSIAGLIERRFGGQVERPYLSVLFVGKK